MGYQGVVKDVTVSKERTILSYDILLANNHITSHHRRFFRMDILPESPEIPLNLSFQTDDKDILKAGLDQPIPQGFSSFLLKPYIKADTHFCEVEWWRTLTVECVTVYSI